MLQLRSRPLSNFSLFEFAEQHLNFFRIHILFYLSTPLFFAGVIYACNGEYPMPFIDCLFNSVSALCVCGLAVTNLSSLTPSQQALLFIEMCIGSPITVSFVVVLVRKYYFYKHYEEFIRHEAEAKRQREEEHARATGFQPRGRSISLCRRTGTVQSQDTVRPPAKRKHSSKKGFIGKLEPDMIRRTTDKPKLVNPTGEWVNNDISKAMHQPGSDVDEFSDPQDPPLLTPLPIPRSNSITRPSRPRRVSDPGASPFLKRPAEAVPMKRSETVAVATKGQELKPVQWLEPLIGRKGRSQGLPVNRTQTIEFNVDGSRPGRGYNGGTSQRRSSSAAPDGRRRGHSMERHTSIAHSQHARPQDARLSGFGGFPLPHEVIGRFLNRFFPNFRRRLHRTLTVPRTTTIISRHSTTNGDQRRRYAPYFSFSALVGRNSVFHMINEQQAEEIGGIEYRALNVLLWIVPTYFIGLQLICFAVIAPYMSMEKWAPTLVPPAQVKRIPSAWFSMFQVTSGITNTGMSLVDQSFLPYQTAYPMVFLVSFLILAGNTAYPIFLRFMIWTISKAVPKNSRLYETLRFLLDHPRRCYIYLFPSQQTYFLLCVVISLTGIDWLCFMILDIGNDVIESIPLGVRFAAGFFQSIAVRAAGFAIVPLSGLSPAVEVTFVIMMYISVYPVAMSVRSTNVYEEHSLGIYPGEGLSVDLDDKEAERDRITVWGRYLALHVQKQLAFDMWWLGVALWLVCIVERATILDESKKWFNIFTVVFELVSAYGTVGLSLGMPDQNFSLCGSFKVLSKLIVCAVMIRGRHRGLPVAIDRAVLLPAQMRHQDEATSIYRTNTRASTVPHTRTYSVSGAPAQNVGRMTPIGEVQTARNSLQDYSSGESALSQKRSPGTDAVRV